MNYQRDIRKQLLIYRLTFTLLLAGTLTIIALKAYVYLSFITVTYFIRDFIFPIYIVFITEASLEVKRIFFAELFTRKLSVDRNKITEVINIDTSVTTASEIDFEYGIFTSGDGTDNKKFELYLIKYLDGTSAERTIKVPLTQIEAKILSERLLPTSSFSKVGLTN